MNSIVVDSVRFRHGADFALGPISLDLAAGSRTALVGPSGSGKTTLLRCIAGLERPAGGSIRIGERLASGDGVLLAPNQRNIGFVFQEGALWPHMRVLDHLTFVAPALGEAAARELLGRLGLADLSRRRPSQLSGGEAQRLALARALALGPDLLLLDEPLHSVDVHLRDELALLIRSVAEERGLTLLVVTHDRGEALAMADDLAVLRKGRLVEHGSSLELVRRPRTAFTAAFLARAACLPVVDPGSGRLETPFGDAERPEGEGPFSLVLLPGDLQCKPGGLSGRVLHCEPDVRGFVSHVRFQGQTVTLLSDEPFAQGNEVELGLEGAPRVLPADLDPHNGAPR